MGTIIIPKAVVRKPGYIYYIDAAGNICEAKMASNAQPKQKTEVKK